MKDNRNKKKLYVIIASAVAAIILIVLLIVLLSQCGGNTPTDAEDGSDGKTAAHTAAQTDAGEGSTGPLPSKQESGTSASTETAETTEDAHRHQFGDWTVLTAPACVTPGERERTCADCGYVQTEKIPPLGHDGKNNECVRCGKKANVEAMSVTPYKYGEGLWITKVNGLTDPDVLVPDVYEGQPVVCIATSAFEDNETVVSISLPDSVTELGTFCFGYCPNLQMIRFGRNIGRQYTGLTCWSPKVEFLVVDPDNTRLYSDHNCVIDPETKTLVLGCSGSVIPDDGSVLTIDSYAFQDCSGLVSITVPSPVTTIESNAFSDCTALVSVEISDSVVTIEENAFQGCQSLKEVRLPAHLKVLANQLFEDCTALEEITIPDEVTEIENECFYGCTSLKTIRMPDTLQRIGNSAFNKCSSLESVTLPSGLTNLGEAFKYCTALRSIVIPDGVEELFTGTFLNCSALTEVTLPKNLIRVPRLLFKNCSSLTDVTIPDGANKIEESAFSGCTSLKTVTLPASVKYVDDDVFEGCTALETVFFGGTKEQWEAIRWRESDDCLKNAQIVYR